MRRILRQHLSSLEELMLQGKDPARFTEELILYFRDLLLYKTAPNLEESLDRALVDDEFTSLAETINPDKYMSYIDTLNKTQQDMRFSNHARIYLEVCLVKLCQTEMKPVAVDLSGSRNYLAKSRRLKRK